MNEDYLKRLMETFQPEAEEYLKVISLGLVEYEKLRDDEQKIHIIEQVYRATHSLKGAARAVNLMQIEQICQTVEDVFAAFKEKKIQESTSLFDDLVQLLTKPYIQLFSPNLFHLF